MTAGSLRFLAAATDLDDRHLLSLASAVAGRRITTLAHLGSLTDDELNRVAVQLNRRMLADPLVLARADAGDPPDYRIPQED